MKFFMKSAKKPLIPLPVVVVILILAFSYLTFYLIQLTGFLNLCYVNEEHRTLAGFENHSIPLNFYLVNVRGEIPMDKKHVQEILEGTNDIWKKYGITFYSNNTTEVFVELELVKKENRERLLNFVLNKENFNESYPVPHIIIANYKMINEQEGWSPNHYNGSLVNIAFVNNWGNVSWTIAHELGHIMNNNDIEPIYGDYNLMTNGGCVREFFHPTYLNEKQIENAFSVARDIERKLSDRK